ncbi:sporulation protein YqfD [Metabacillus herbersteinensis]|uniref:Sporulation protein YqfD n=1 Tax=Metabacillus herbersteinensis TaxID=283816 RepID=A0ABV6G9I2_9BACI
MKNQWTNYLFGIVRVIIEGNGTERFLNDCIRLGIPVWNVKRKSKNALTFFIRLQDVHAIRKVVRGNECKCRFERKVGLPFLLLKTRKNSGFAAGIVVFLLIIFLLSNMVWGIQIEGAKPETEHLIKKELNRIGVKTGKSQFFIKNPDTIQKELTDNIEEITWVGVELNGTTFHLKVVEKNQPEQDKLISPRHIVAKKKAVVSKIFVEQGQPLVTVNEHVEKGQILVSGLIGKEGKEEEVAAKAEIHGETWYKSEIKVPLKSTFNVFTGEDKKKHYLKFWSTSVPIWGFKNELFSSFEVEEDTRYLKFLRWTLPIAYVKETYREKEEVVRNYTAKQAKEAALEIGRKHVEGKLDEDGEVKGEKVLHETNENGKVKLIVLYQVIEDIVKTTPIVQGD